MVLTREEPELSHGQQAQGLYMDEATVAGIPMARHRMAPGQLICPLLGMKLRRPKTMLVMPHTWAKRAYKISMRARAHAHPPSQSALRVRPKALHADACFHGRYSPST